MAIRLPGPTVVLTGEDCARLNKPLGELLAALARRDGQVPRHLVEIREEIRRAATEFRITTLANPSSGPGSGTVRDTSGSRSRPSGASERLTATEAAHLTGVSRELICRLAVRGVLQGTRTGWRGAWELDAGSVAAWSASRKERSEAA